MSKQQGKMVSYHSAPTSREKSFVDRNYKMLIRSVYRDRPTS
jgi:hypothetical protein